MMHYKYLSKYYYAVNDGYKNINRDFIISSVLMLIIAGINVLPPYFLSCSVNLLSAPGNQFTQFYLYVALFGLSWTLANIIEWIKNIISATFLVKTESALHTSVFRKIIYSKRLAVLDAPPGQIIEDMTRGRQALVSLIYTLFWGLLPLLLQVLFSFVFILKIVGFFLSLFYLLALGVFALLCYFFSERSKHIHHKIMDAHNSVTSHLTEKLHFLEDIKINHAFRNELDALNTITNGFIHSVSNGNKKIGFYMVYQSIFIGVLMIGFTIYAAKLTTHGLRPAGDYILISGYIIQLTSPLILVGGSFINLKKDFEALRRLDSYFSLSTIEPTTHLLENIESNVIFSANSLQVMIAGKPIINRIGFTINQGQFFVITGRSGIGKTSLLKSMIGLTPVVENMLWFKGIDMSKISLGDIVADCAIVTQHPMLITGTLRSNLLYGCRSAVSDQALLNILNLLQLTTLATGDERGSILEHQITPASTLSGGEKHRIAIGRALARHKKILIMDEPFAALDDKLGMAILRGLKRQGLTIIITTHKRSALALADNMLNLG